MNTVVCAKPETPITECGLHSHSAWEIVYHLTGHTVSQIGDKSYDIAAGDVTVIPPGTEHGGSSDAYYTDMYMQAKNLDFFGMVVVRDIDNNILTLMNMLHKTLAEKENNYSQVADNLTGTICAYVKKLSGIDYKYPFINGLKNTIYSNISNPDFDLAGEIVKTGFNTDYLRRRFKEILGRTPLEYLTWLRINQAKVFLVQDSFVSIEDVSKKCGFNDSFYFSVCFKKHTDTSPLQYRKIHCK